MVSIGTVTTYDAARGLGTVSDGHAEHAFHCTALSDGSRRIEEGTKVAYVLVRHHTGRLEARAVTKLEEPPGT